LSKTLCLCNKAGTAVQSCGQSKKQKEGITMSKKSQQKADKSVDYLHPDGKVPTKPKTEEEKVNKEQAEDSTQLARKLEEKDAR
jgi:hypothetical protein